MKGVRYSMETKVFSIASYTGYIAEHRLMASRCQQCQMLFLPPRPVCPQCHGREMSWQQLSGRGKVRGFTSISITPTTMTAKGFGRDNPYLTAVVQTEEGPGVTAILEGVDAKAPDKVKIGMAVAAHFKEEGQAEAKKVTLIFKPA